MQQVAVVVEDDWPVDLFYTLFSPISIDRGLASSIYCMASTTVLRIYEVLEPPTHRLKYCHL